MSAKGAAEYVGPVKKHHLPTTMREAIAVCLRGFEGKTVKVTIAEYRSTRSPSQNAYYWSVIVPYWQEIYRHYGNIKTANEVHAYLVGELAGFTRQITAPSGEILFHENGSPKTEPMSTKDLSTKEFTELIDIARAEALSEHQVDIPPPDKNYKEKSDE